MCPLMGSCGWLTRTRVGLDMEAMMVCDLVTSGIGFVDGKQDLVSPSCGDGDVGS